MPTLVINPLPKGDSQAQLWRDARAFKGALACLRTYKCLELQMISLKRGSRPDANPLFFLMGAGLDNHYIIIIVFPAGGNANRRSHGEDR